MSITCVSILNQSFTNIFSLIEINIFINSGFEILKNDAHDGEWIKYPKTQHPKFGYKVTLACLVAKLYSKNNIQAQGIFHLVEMYWITNSDGTLYTHLNVSWVS